MLTTTTDTIAPPTPVLPHPFLAIVGALSAGIAFDLLAWGRPSGPGLAIAMAAISSVIWWITEHATTARNELRAVFVGATLFASVAAVRDSPVLIGLSVLGWIALVAIGVAMTGSDRLTSWTIAAHVRSIAGWVAAFVEPFHIPAVDLGDRLPGSRAFLKRSLPVLRGVVLGTGVLMFFALILGSADPIFGDIISETFDLDLSFDRIWRFGLVVGGVAWMTLGMARRALAPGPTHRQSHHKSRAVTESMIMLGGLNALFAGFLAVQFRYLFGGSGGSAISYAEYARQGFFQLVFVAVCVLTLVLFVDFLVQRRVRTLDMLHLALVAQTFVVMTSAVVRMAAYTDAFGLSELRVYTTVFMAWIAVVFCIAIGTVLRGRRERFAFGALISAIVFVFALVAVNPDRVIVSTNLARAKAGASLDVDYLAGLSSDAVPALVSGLSGAAALDRTAALDRMTEIRRSLEAEASEGWRSWSLADRRALNALETLTN